MNAKLLNIAIIPSLLLLLFNLNISVDDGYNNEVPVDSVSTVRFSFTGDLMCHSPQFQFAKVSEDSFDFEPVYRFIEPYLSSSDCTFGNLETVLAGKDKKYSGYPFFNSPDSYVEALVKSGFDFVFTSNNHSLDRNEPGLLRTLSQVRNSGLGSAGTYSSQRDRDSIRIIERNGITTAVLSYTYGTNGQPIPAGKDYIINLIKEDLLVKDLIAAKKLKTDLVLVYFHFGEEYKKLPNDFQKNIVRIAKSNGADIIIGSHPHVLQPFDYYKTEGGNLDTGFVAYSLGNFISNQRDRYTDAGVVLSLELEKNNITGKVKINKVEYTPTWVFKGTTEHGNEYIILPFTKNVNSFKFLSAENKRQMLEAFNDTKNIVTTFSNNFQLKGD